jgi:aryl carrier-like protein
VDEAQRVMAPKVQGAQVLAEVFGEDPLDFVMLCSSLSALLGGFGQLDYCAANSYLDAFAVQNIFQQHGAQTISVNWDTWGEVGMAVNTPVPDELKQSQAEGLRHGIKTRDGMEAFERILSFQGRQVATSTIDLPLRIEQATRMQPVPAVSTPLAGSNASHPRPSVSSEYAAPRTRIETLIAGIWQELLGIEEVGVHDNFLELGGHSLLAIQLISRIRDVLHYELSVQALFDAPTITAIAALIDGEQPVQERSSEPPALMRLPREQYRGRISPEGTVELPQTLRKSAKGPAGNRP